MFFLEESYDWKKLKLYDFLNEGNYPLGWEEFFKKDEAQVELKKISESLFSVKKKIYPELHKVFRAFYKTRPEQVKVVIIGQDCYYDGNAVGLCFSIPKIKTGEKINVSLLNIYKELENEGFVCERNGSLVHWAEQGCFMINTALTVEEASPESHLNLWSKFSKILIEYLSASVENVAWILLGKHAQNYSKYIKGKNSLFETSHPSGFSCHRGFFGSNIFRNVNDFLKEQGKEEIKW